MNDEKIQPNLNDLIEKAKKIAVIPSRTASGDAFGAALGLQIMLKDKGKDTCLIYQGSKLEQFADLVTDSEILSNVVSRDLLISVDYSNTPASQVSYSSNNGVFVFKIGPVTKDFDLKRIQAGVTSLNYDLIFVIGAQITEDLGSLYADLEEEFKKATVVNLDHVEANQRFGHINIVDSSADTLSLLVLNSSLAWGLNISRKAALSMLRGMTYKEPNKG